MTKVKIRFHHYENERKRYNIIARASVSSEEVRQVAEEKFKAHHVAAPYSYYEDEVDEDWAESFLKKCGIVIMESDRPNWGVVKRKDFPSQGTTAVRDWAQPDHRR